MPQVRPLLHRRIVRDFVGRAAELDSLLKILEPAGPLVIHLHGIAGIGKSTLLDVFAQRARMSGATVIQLDCNGIEPTEKGLLSELALATGGVLGSPEEIATRLGQVGSRVVIALDTYEVFRLMDSWLRRVFIPLLPDNVRIILCGREGPVTAGFQTIQLGCLDRGSALESLFRTGVRHEEANAMATICCGHPLALTLAAALPDGELTMAASAGAGPQIIAELANIYLSEIPDPQTRRALEAASMVRRVTEPLFGALLPDSSPHDAQERIRSLPFVQIEKDGLHVHDAVRQAIALAIRTNNPQRYQAYRQAAYRFYVANFRTAVAPDLWRSIADLVYLLENSTVREAFFPTGSHEYALEQARPEDESAILEIIARHETAAMARAMVQWVRRAPETFVVARDRTGQVAGFYCAFSPTRYARLQSEDPICQKWLLHLDEQPAPRNQRFLFLRRWLAAETGEAPSAVQAACWMDLMRKYLELRPTLRRVYLTVRDVSPYADILRPLDFEILPDCGIKTDGESYSTAMLDFGPSSVDGWLARLVAAEYGVQEDDLLDSAARELVLDGRRIGLTRLEYGVMEYLHTHVGKPIPRVSFLENVWEQNHDGGSNIVDVVIHALRKKLGGRASLIETVPGVGYRLRRDASVPCSS